MEYVPMGQKKQDEPFLLNASDDWPAGQEVHDEAPDELYVPTAQLVHAIPPEE